MVRARAAGLVAVATGIALSLWAFDTARKADDERIKSVLELRAEWRSKDLEEKIKIAASSADAIAAFIAMAGEVKAPLFQRFARLNHDDEDISSAIAWAPFVWGARRDDA